MRLDRIESILERLVEAQRCTGESLRELRKSPVKLEKHFSRFEAIFGAAVEDEAGGVLRSVL
ncbi:MAG: hypothetical protein RML36_06580 [Anaerolineae bacterium]|nr:hypothetical protein [Anaerolineae bacterium]